MELDAAKRYGAHENGPIGIEKSNDTNEWKNDAREPVMQGKRTIS